MLLLAPVAKEAGSCRMNMEAKSPQPKGGEGHGQGIEAGPGQMDGPKFQLYSSMPLLPQGESLNLQLVIPFFSLARLHPSLWALIIWYHVNSWYAPHNFSPGAL